MTLAGLINLRQLDLSSNMLTTLTFHSMRQVWSTLARLSVSYNPLHATVDCRGSALIMLLSITMQLFVVHSVAAQQHSVATSSGMQGQRVQLSTSAGH